jgi:hypothetical protein
MVLVEFLVIWLQQLFSPFRLFLRRGIANFVEIVNQTVDVLMLFGLFSAKFHSFLLDRS